VERRGRKGGAVQHFSFTKRMERGGAKEKKGIWLVQGRREEDSPVEKNSSEEERAAGKIRSLRTKLGERGKSSAIGKKGGFELGREGGRQTSAKGGRVAWNGEAWAVSRGGGESSPQWGGGKKVRTYRRWRLLEMERGGDSQWEKE